MQRESSPPGGGFLHAVSVATCAPVVVSGSASASGSIATGYEMMTFASTATQPGGAGSCHQSWPAFAARQPAVWNTFDTHASCGILVPVAGVLSSCSTAGSHANAFAVDDSTHVLVGPSHAWPVGHAAFGPHSYDPLGISGLHAASAMNIHARIL